MNDITARLADSMRKELTRSKYIDVSSGSERLLHVSKGRLNTALNQLIREGYSVISFREKGSGRPTFRILCRKEDKTISDILKQRKILTGNKRITEV